MLDVVTVSHTGQKRNRSIYQVQFLVHGAPAVATVEFSPANLVKRRIISAKYNPQTKEHMDLIVNLEKTFMPIMNVALKKEQKDWLLDATERSEAYQKFH